MSDASPRATTAASSTAPSTPTIESPESEPESPSSAALSGDSTAGSAAPSAAGSPAGGSASIPAWIADQLQAHIATAEAAESVLPELRVVGRLLCDSFAAGGILYTFGNGGSAADAQHFTGEIIGHYKRDRRPLGAVTLSTDPTTMTCIANDYSYDDVFSRQVQGLARPGDVVAAFTTSGRSANIVSALEAAQRAGATTVLFGGGDGGPAREFADHLLLSPSTTTPRIQEFHTFMLHVLSEMVDAWADGDEEYAL